MRSSFGTRESDLEVEEAVEDENEEEPVEDDKDGVTKGREGREGREGDGGDEEAQAGRGDDPGCSSRSGTGAR